ncbi:MAG: tRNA lysidine(34) synthetase TilS [Deltaproteobacteria bacterium CG_4_10_14_0_2_um_filter_43_8]|nr:MAG: tRNA lysidine(34) synthetase TilS [Deltaproteobacteria bacterium CG11_big_fil_rev_8_21_14_0_20_42_23]PJA21647.1 MAG: tRNA lysidine(34) synthetase TilS [Deltaproteobacteria bacterium CG_4_10_14_0_2_um_filter_43_8]PJC63785.1 MAG: tRNA lysidine(34) synthetase TilS [Deltaproteobacteria bacterium CG_4_9_14_0_2_um_filter_42_21]
MLYPRFKHFIEQKKMFSLGETLVVGASAGVDSMVLFDLLLKLSHVWKLKLVLVHVNYKLRGEHSDLDEMLVQEKANAASVPFFRFTHTEKSEGNFQEKARTFRRSKMEEVLDQQNAACIALAHHQNDQAETFLLRLLRGTGLKGLGGMKGSSLSKSGKKYIRPLLPFTREEIEAYAEEHKIAYRHDASNDDVSYKRNWIRHEVLQQLKQANPKIVNHLSHLSSQLREDEEALEYYVEAALQKVSISEDFGKCSLKREIYNSLPKAIRLRLSAAVFQKLFLESAILSADHREKIDHIALRKEGGKAQYFLPLNVLFTRDHEKIYFQKENVSE